MIVKNMSINKKISFVFIFVIMAVVISSNVIFYFLVSDIIINRTIEQQEKIISHNSTNMDNLLNNINLAVGNLCRDGKLVEVLNSDCNGSFELYSGREAIERQFRQYFIQLMDFTDYNFAFFFIDDAFPVTEAFFPVSLNTAVSTRHGVFKADNQKKESWYLKTIELNGAFHCFYLEGDNQRLYISRLVRNPYINIYSMEKMGVMLMGFDVREFEKQFDAAKLTDHAQVYLLDEDKRVIFSNNASLRGKGVEEDGLISYVNDHIRTENHVLEYEDQHYVTAISRLKWGLRLISVIPYTDILAELNVVTKMIIIITVIAVFIGIGLTVIFSFSITRPIKKLAGVMNAVRNESSIRTNIDYPSHDEVGILYKSFNKMMRRIDGLVADVYESGVKQKSAELKALQAQINPHFIYNTLDSVNWMALLNNQNNIVRMVSSLASILKYSIKDPDHFVLLKEELDHVRNYVNIQAMRYEDCFEVVYDIQPSEMNLKLPKFLLQPLVENAVVHGVANIKLKGRIVISCMINGSQAVIRVEDNGAGADVHELNAYLEGKKTSVKDSDGFGIKNVHQRIKMSYGEGYGLNYADRCDGGVVAEIRIPYKE